jgi:hypothetical protein
MGSPGVDGNTLARRLPETEYVRKVGHIKSVLIFPCIPERRDWRALLTNLFAEDYPEPRALQSVVEWAIKRIQNGYIPVVVLREYNEVKGFNRRSALK